MKPKILVGCPISDYKRYCIDEYLEGISNLTYSNFELFLVDNSETSDFYEELKSKGIDVKRIEYVPSAKNRIVKSRNLIVDKFLEGDYDYFFSLEMDVIPPKDIIERLLESNKEIVSGVYFKPFIIRDQNDIILSKEIMPIAYQRYSENRLKRMSWKDVDNKDIVEVEVVGLGCILIKREVFEKKIKFRWEQGNSSFDDFWFCKDVKRLGYNIFMNNSLKCKHLVTEMDWNKIEK